MSKKLKSLFISSEADTKDSASKLWEFSDDAYIEVIAFGDLYPELFMPEDVAKLQVEILVFQKFKDKDREVCLEWLEKNIENIS